MSAQIVVLALHTCFMACLAQSVLITGGLGFIGGHLASQLLQEGHTVMLYDLRLHGSQSWHEALRSHPRCCWIQADLAKPDHYPQLVESLNGIDTVFHFAANANSRQSLCDRDIDLHSGIEATWNLLYAMAEQQVGHIVFASSQLVYGEPPGRVLHESQGPLLPISLYGAAKLAAEGIISAHSHLHGIRSTLLRFGNIIGPRMSYGIVLDFVRKLMQNPDELEILGDGRQQRNYLHVDDAVRGILTAWQHRGNSRCQVFNVGNDDCISAAEVAALVAAEVVDSSPRYCFTGGKRGWRGDVPDLRCDLSAIKALGWQPSCPSAIAVSRAARATYDLYRSHDVLLQS